MMDGKIHVKDPQQAKRIVKALNRKQQRQKIDDELELKGAFQIIEELQKKVEKLEKKAIEHEKRIQGLRAIKFYREMAVDTTQ